MSVQQARELIERGQKAQARALLRQELDANPENAVAWGLVAVATDDRDEAVAALQRVLALEPGNTWASRRLRDLRQSAPSPATPVSSVRVERLDEDLQRIDDDVRTLTQEIRDLRNYEVASDEQERRRTGLLPVLVFLGTLIGSLLGLTADFGETLSNLEQFAALTYPRLCVVGSSTILEEGLGMSEDWRVGFREDNNARIRYRAIGSGAGVEAAANGECVHILAMSEPMTDQQEAALEEGGVQIQCAAEIAYDVVVFVTDTNNPINATTIERLRGVLTGRFTDWGEIGGLLGQPITLLARSGSGTTEYVLIEVAGYSQRTGGSEFPPEANYQVCSSNEECLDMTLTTPGALYWVSASWIRAQPAEYITLMPIVGDRDEAIVVPLSEEFNVRDYSPALVRPLYLYVVDNGSGSPRQLELAEQYLRYVRGLEGQQIIEQYGFYTHFNRPLEVIPPLPEGFGFPTDGPRQICQPTS